MQEYIIVTGTVTYAIKAKEVLRKNGFSANVIKISEKDSNIGCGYAVNFKGDIDKAIELLEKYSVKVLKIKKKI